MIGIRKIGVTVAALGALTAVGVSASPASAATSRCAAIITQMNEAEALMDAAQTPQQYAAAQTLYSIRAAVVAASNC